ncbi:MAG: aldehyde ferredoxin oxidoreductase family protein [Deltaproteobacteria bacterium]|nr:aldehyde ferredoxin oxidoreductase family protein [Deltaproteobacteria bacterium]
MQDIVGTGNRVLDIDLSTKKVKIYQVKPRERRLYLGGKGLGLKLLYDRMHPGLDPLGEDNIIAFMPGVLMGTGAPCSGKFAAVTKSPLTRLMASSSCGGPFGMNLKTAGWDGLMIRGRAGEPTYLLVTSEGVEFKDASGLWGKDTLSSQKEIIGEGNGGLVIGPAGENLVHFANIASGDRFLGRGGMGAVLGSKNIKAVVAKGGDYKIKPADQAAFEKLKRKANAYINNNRITGNLYRKFGTPANVALCLDGEVLPVMNFRDGVHPLGLQISGEETQKHRNTRHHTCRPCSILCGKKGFFGGEEIPAPEYETVALLGSNLGVFDIDRIAKWNRICGMSGLDTISAGGTLAWVMEAGERGLLQSPLTFGSPDGVSEALTDIALMRGFGREMALGSKALSEKYGGAAFAMQVKGLELAGYDPRGSFGQGLAFAVANRGGCHLSAFLVGQEVFLGLLRPYAIRAKADYVKFFESLNNCVNSLQTCLFTLFAYLMESPLTKYTPNSILSLLMQELPQVAIPLIDYSIYRDLWSAVTGINMSLREYLEAGDRITVIERYMNTREGIWRLHDTLPDRLLREGRRSDPASRTVPLEKLRAVYYKKRGYDHNGIPTPRTIKKLGIDIHEQ